MNNKRLDKLERELLMLRRSPVGLASGELVRLAEKLGRTRFPRGKHPTYVREESPQLSPPLSIPSHSKDMPSGTARKVIDALLDDVDAWRTYLGEGVEEEEADDEDDDR